MQLQIILAVLLGNSNNHRGVIKISGKYVQEKFSADHFLFRHTAHFYPFESLNNVDEVIRIYFTTSRRYLSISKNGPHFGAKMAHSFTHMLTKEVKQRLRI